MEHRKRILDQGPWTLTAWVTITAAAAALAVISVIFR